MTTKRRGYKDDRGEIISMSITDIINRKTGAVSGPAASVQDVGAVVTKSLEDLVKTKQLASAADAVKALLHEDKGSPFEGLKELGFNIGDMLQHSSNQTKVAMDELHRIREQVLEEKAKQVSIERQDQAAMNTLLQQMMAMQNQSYENQLKLMTEMYNQRIQQLEGGGKGPESDPMAQLISNLSVGLLKERLTESPPTAKDQVTEAMGLVNSMREMFAMNTSSNNMQAELQRMKLDLEMAKLDIEREERMAERLDRREREEQRAETTSALISQLAQIVPAVVEAIKNRPVPSPEPVAAVAPKPEPSPVHYAPEFQTGARISRYNAGNISHDRIQQMYSSICPNCGEDLAQTGLNHGACPQCGAVLATEHPPVAASRHEGGILEI